MIPGAAWTTFPPSTRTSSPYRALLQMCPPPLPALASPRITPHSNHFAPRPRLRTGTMISMRSHRERRMSMISHTTSLIAQMQGLGRGAPMRSHKGVDPHREQRRSRTAKAALSAKAAQSSSVCRSGQTQTRYNGPRPSLRMLADPDRQQQMTELLRHHHIRISAPRQPPLKSPRHRCTRLGTAGLHIRLKQHANAYTQLLSST